MPASERPQSAPRAAEEPPPEDAAAEPAEKRSAAASAGDPVRCTCPPERSSAPAMAEAAQYDSLPLREGGADKKDDDSKGVKLEAKMSLLNGITVS